MSTATYGHVEPWQRFRNGFPCPICEGHGNLRRRRSERCAGFISKDERYAFCAREEYAGNLRSILTAVGPTFRHLIDGECWCGREHGTPLPPIQRAKAAPQPSAPQPQTGPLPRVHKGATIAEESPYRRADGSLAYRVARYEYPLQPGE